jgi:hypothetical protein
VLADCIHDATCSQDCCQFKGIAVRALNEYADALNEQLAAAVVQKGGTSEATVAALLDNLCAVEAALDSAAASAWTVAQSADGLFNCQWQQSWPAQGMSVLQGAQNSAVTLFARQAMQQHWWLHTQ